MSPTILITGGYGNTGSALTKLLLQETDCQIILGGRSFDKADKLARVLNAKFPGERVEGIRVDVSDTANLAETLQGIDLLVVASSTSQYTYQVARTAIVAGVDYLDVQYSTDKIRVLQSLEYEIADARLCFITDGGFHPGLPAAMIRYAATFFDRLTRAEIGSVIKIDWAVLEVARSTVEELVGEFMHFQNLVFRNGKWQSGGILSWIKPKWMNFGIPFGQQYCVPMFLEEMRPIPQIYPYLERTGFFVGGFNWFVDWLISPLAVLLPRVSHDWGLNTAANMMEWGLKKFSRPPYGIVLKLEAEGIKNGMPLEIEILLKHPDGYQITAIPLAACLLQVLDGSIRKPGLWYQSLVVEPQRFFDDLQRMGVLLEHHPGQLNS